MLDLNNSLPPWDESFLLMDKSETEIWKWRPALDAAKALYEQWAEVYGVVAIFADSLDDTNDFKEDFTKSLIHQNMMAVSPKIMSAAGDTLYIIKMENASIIRVACRQLMEQVGFAALTGMADPEHKEVIADAMNRFKQLFKAWVETFEKDEVDDDWGLY